MSLVIVSSVIVSFVTVSLVVMTGVAILAVVRVAETSANLTRRMIYRVYVDVSGAGPDRLDHLGETLGSGVDSLATNDGRGNDVGLSEGAGNGGGRGCGARLGRWRAHWRREIGAQEEDNLAAQKRPAIMNV
jgi:hypothetical protein